MTVQYCKVNIFITTVYDVCISFRLYPQDTINRRKLAENGVNLALVEDRDEEEGGKKAIKLPGTRSGDKSRRAFRPEVRVTSLTFSPTGKFIIAVQWVFHYFFKTLYAHNPII